VPIAHLAVAQVAIKSGSEKIKPLKKASND
jgi:hypothetical protein